MGFLFAELEEGNLRLLVFWLKKDKTHFSPILSQRQCGGQKYRRRKKGSLQKKRVKNGDRWGQLGDWNRSYYTAVVQVALTKEPLGHCGPLVNGQLVWALGSPVCISPLNQGPQSQAIDPSLDLYTKCQDPQTKGLAPSKGKLYF